MRYGGLVLLCLAALSMTGCSGSAGDEDIAKAQKEENDRLRAELQAEKDRSAKLEAQLRAAGKK